MIFTETKLKGAYIIELEKLQDNRGFFARTFCRREFEARRLNPNIVQCNISYNKKKGTLRGMHYQAAPYQEAKLISCIRGAIYDVIIDIRPDSPTYRQWLSVELTAHHPPLTIETSHSPINLSTHKLLYVPEGFAHGFLTLSDNAEVCYQMSEFYMPDYARGIRWNDPAFNIKWPIAIAAMSEKDMQYPDFLDNHIERAQPV
ncbi:MAG: dTDP-4-dehydrorhamnose 3,5-epimerase [Nitrospirota bacterium]